MRTSLIEHPRIAGSAEAGYSAPYLHLLDDEVVPGVHPREYCEKKLAQVFRAIRSSRGQGRGEGYQPWIRITRGFSSPVSHQVHAHLGIHRRCHHFLSKLEHHAGLLLSYLGAIELRECLPMWPTDHPHPWDASQGLVDGLLGIAMDAGLDHGNYIGTEIPYIGTLDMLVALPWQGGILHLGVSCKPDEVHAASQRARERVELDRLYCQRLGAVHIREGGATFNQVLLRNLDSYRPLQSEKQRFRDDPKLLEFCSEFERRRDHLPLHAAIDGAGRAADLTHADASRFWRLGAWMHMIDVDMRCPISMLDQAPRGGPQTVDELSKHFLGAFA